MNIFDTVLEMMGLKLKSPVPKDQILDTPEYADRRRQELLQKREDLFDLKDALESELKYKPMVDAKQKAKDEGWVDQKPITIDDIVKANEAQPRILGASTGERILDLDKYQGMSKTPINQPSQEIIDLLFEIMPNDATRSAVQIEGENKRYNPSPKDNYNSDGSIDVGLAQNNNNTFNEIMNIGPLKKRMNDSGINTIDDTRSDPRKSIMLMKAIMDYKKMPRWTGDKDGHPYGSAWYGWQNKGYNLFPEKSIEEVASDPAYFKLKEFYNKNKGL